MKGSTKRKKLIIIALLACFMMENINGSCIADSYSKCESNLDCCEGFSCDYSESQRCYPGNDKFVLIYLQYNFKLIRVES